MLIYLTHSTGYDFKRKLYTPLINSNLFHEHNIILPHDQNDVPINSKETLKIADLILAEVSYPSTGQGIELGWAEVFKKPVIAFYQQEQQYSKSLDIIVDKIFSYYDSNDLIKKIKAALK